MFMDSLEKQQQFEAKLKADKDPKAYEEYLQGRREYFVKLLKSIKGLFFKKKE